MSVISTKVEAVTAAHFLEANPDIGLEILHEVAYVYGAIGIGQS